MKINFVRLARMIMKFAEVETDKGILIYEGELEVGTEVFVEKGGEIVPAEDGEYIYADEKLVVKDGKIESKDFMGGSEEELAKKKKVSCADDAELLDRDARIAELEADIADKIAEIEGLKAEVDSLKAQLDEMKKKMEESVAMSAKKTLKSLESNSIITNKENKALRFFQNK